jgi:hypothetical protein
MKLSMKDFVFEYNFDAAHKSKNLTLDGNTIDNFDTAVKSEEQMIALVVPTIKKNLSTSNIY